MQRAIKLLNTMQKLALGLVISNALIRALAAALALLGGIVLVRLLGEVAYGQYTVYITLCSLLAIVARSGLDATVTRMSALAYADSNRAEIRHLLVRSSISVSGMTAIAVATYGVLDRSVRLWSSQPLVVPLPVIGLGVLFVAAVSVYSGIARGQGRILVTECQESIMKPVLVMVAAGVFSIGLGVDPQVAGILAFLVAGGIVAVGLFFIAMSSRPKARPIEVATKESRPRLFPPPRALHYILIGGLSFALFQFDTLVLARYRSAEDVGAYNMACNFTRLIIIISLILAVQSQPRLAIAWARGNRREYLDEIKRPLLLGLASALMAWLLLAITGSSLLGLVASGFERASPSLMILATGHVFNSSVILLTAAFLMAGMERVVVGAQLLGASAAIPLYFVLIPPYGMEGAAISASLGMFVTSVTMVSYYRKLNCASNVRSDT